MLMMRLQRIGRKNSPSYRIVVVDKRTSVKSNKVTDLIGTYNPKAGEIIIKAEKAKQWLSNGVQPSDTVYNMLVSKQIINGKKRNKLPKKSPIIDEAKLKAEAETTTVEGNTATTTDEVTKETVITPESTLTETEVVADTVPAEPSTEPTTA